MHSEQIQSDVLCPRLCDSGNNSALSEFGRCFRDNSRARCFISLEIDDSICLHVFLFTLSIFVLIFKSMFGELEYLQDFFEVWTTSE